MLHSMPLANDEPALAGAPMICATQKLLAFLLEHGTIGLTQGKAFQRRFVHWAAAEFAWPGWEEDKLFSVNKVLNEYDFPPLEALHFVLLKLKLIRHEKQTCRLTKAGRAMAGSPGDLFNESRPSTCSRSIMPPGRGYLNHGSITGAFTSTCCTSKRRAA